ncbi:cation transporter [Streptomyces sp. NPDC004980]
MAAEISLGPAPARREVLAHRVRLLVAATIAYNVIEAIVALTAGTIASSSALVGFGLDSIVEVSSAVAVAWQFSAGEHTVREAREKKALRIIALSFFALAAFVSVDAIRALAGGAEAESSIPGIVLAALLLAVMPFLSAAQRRAGRELGPASAVADSKQTLLCTYLSAVLLQRRVMAQLREYPDASADVLRHSGVEIERADTPYSEPSALLSHGDDYRPSRVCSGGRRVTPGVAWEGIG